MKKADSTIAFSRPSSAPFALEALQAALLYGRLEGNGPKTKACHRLLQSLSPNSAPLLTNSGTAALEMAALLLGLREGDEVVMPSWTFSSTANAVVLRGAVPVFVDVRLHDLNVDAALVEAALTPRTRAIFCVHYAGVACDLDALLRICDRYGLALVEDAAQGVGATWRGAALGSVGDFGALSFHGSKNLACGEGGALLVNRPELVSRAEMVWEKGTDRARFTRGEVAWYEWRTVGSSYLPSEITAALLETELSRCAEITEVRRRIWARYDQAFRAAGLESRCRLPNPADASHNGHIYHVRLRTREIRTEVQRRLAAGGIEALTHYVPLHSSPAGRRYGRVASDMLVTDDAGSTLIRLPIYAGLTADEQRSVIAGTIDAVQRASDET